MKNSSLLAFLLPALAAVLCIADAAAQAPAHLVGITRVTPLLRHHSHTNCAPMFQCPLPGMPSALGLPAYVGGTGWDPKKSGAWVSEGTTLALVDDNCQMLCPPMPIPTLTPNAFVTGIEVVVGMDQIWLIDSAGVLHFYSNTCPPQPLGTCNTGLAQTAIGQVTTGLAVDEGSGFAFISYPQFPVGPTLIMVVPLAAPCAPTGEFFIPPCATIGAAGPVLGLACDWGNQTLYATDGATTTAIPYVPGGVTVFPTGANCCPPLVVLEPMIGLALRPGRATPNGQPCANGPCPSCPMLHTTRNDPLVGNLAFTLGLDLAAPNSFAFCLVGGGPCANIGPVAPPLCGPILTTNYLGYLGAVFTGGGINPCDGTASFVLPLPAVPALANAVFSSQCVNVCFASTGLGTTMSNCLTWQVQGH